MTGGIIVRTVTDPGTGPATCGQPPHDGTPNPPSKRTTGYPPTYAPYRTPCGPASPAPRPGRSSRTGSAYAKRQWNCPLPQPSSPTPPSNPSGSPSEREAHTTTDPQTPTSPRWRRSAPSPSDNDRSTSTDRTAGNSRPPHPPPDPDETPATHPPCGE